MTPRTNPHQPAPSSPCRGADQPHGDPTTADPAGNGLSAPQSAAGVPYHSGADTKPSSERSAGESGDSRTLDPDAPRVFLAASGIAHWRDPIGVLDVTACQGLSLATWDTVPAGEVPEEDRCRSSGCARLWREFDEQNGDRR